jgi:hypothetical protein
MEELWIHGLVRCGESGICSGVQFSRSWLRHLFVIEAAPRKRECAAGRDASTSNILRFAGMFYAQHDKVENTKKASRPTVPCDGPRMNPSVDVGCPPRSFRHLRMAQRCAPDLSSSRAPVHSALVQKSVTVITNPAGRLSIRMLGKSRALGKWKSAKRWQVVCNQSNEQFTNGLAGGRDANGCNLGKIKPSESCSLVETSNVPASVLSRTAALEPPPSDHRRT